MTTNVSTRPAVPYSNARAEDIFSAADWPPLVLAPDLVMRSPLTPGTKYRLHESMLLPRLLIPAVTTPGGLELITFEGVSPAVSLLVDGDTTPHIWGRDIAALAFESFTIIDVSNAGSGRGSVLFDLVGGNGPLSLFGPSQAAIVLFKRVGNLVDIGINGSDQNLSTDNEAGLVVRLTPASLGQSHFISSERFIGAAALADNRGAGVSFIGDTSSVSIIGCGVQLGKAANSFLFIDSGTPPGSYSITGNNYVGSTSGSFFRPDEVEAITAQADASIAVLAFSDSATAPGVDTTVAFAGIVDIIVGQVILISGGTYAGTYTVVRVAADLLSFDIAFVFAGASAGTLSQVEHTVASCKFVRDETVTITGTVNYNGTAQILRRTDTAFVLPQLWVVDDAAGTATSIGRDQESPGVLATANGAQEDSTILGEASWNGNASSTTIVDGTYGALVLTGVTLAPGAQRVSLNLASAGRLRYDGEAPIRLALTFSLFAQKAGAALARYRIAVSVNGAIPVFASAPYALLELRDTNRQIVSVPTVELNPGDTIQPMIAGFGFTDAVTFSDGEILLRR